MKTHSLQFKKALCATLIFLLLSIIGMTETVAQNGALNGVFSVSDTSQVHFSQGNLQYKAIDSIWRFAENQYDYIGNANSNISQFYDGWIDLFGWGTSGYDHGANRYQPWSTGGNYNDYYAYGVWNKNLNDESGMADWGYNAISNGGLQENYWRTLSQSEWNYVLFTRNTTSGIRFAKATIREMIVDTVFNDTVFNNIHGIVLLPDNWNESAYVLNDANEDGAPYETNMISDSTWETLEDLGVVFLPAAGNRNGNSNVLYANSYGYYWSTTYGNNSYAYSMDFSNNWIDSEGGFYRFSGRSVRLVCYAQTVSFNIGATTIPMEGGEVSGTGIYSAGAECTLTATANEGYIFINWTENGEVVSSDAEYTFTVTSNRNLVANFMDSSHYWIPNGEDYDDNMTFTCVVEIDGEEQYTTMLEVGAFCGEECRGSQRANYFAPSDRYIIQMTVFGEVNDVISFRLYDHQQNAELILNPPTPVTFSTNGYGSLFEPYILNFTSTVTHTQALNSGWNWWSTYVELSDNDGLSQLENSIGSAGIIIKSRSNGYVEAYQYNGETNWFGTLNSINNEQMYKIRTNAACYATIVGDAATPLNHPITINSGWNWIGFPCNQNVSVDVAMSSFSPENNDIIKGRNGYTTYYADGNYNMWFGTLNTFEPGKGYMYRSNSSAQKTLVFQTSRGEAIIENITSENNVFQPADENYADNMTLTAVVDLDGEELRSEDYELAAFVGDECRGSVRLMYVEPVDRFVAFLTIFGELEEDLHFQLTDGVAVNFSTDQIAYAADGIVGSLDNPFVLHFGTLEIDENNFENVKVYPNPSDGIFNIEGQNIRKIEVFNAFGQPVCSKKTENGFVKIDLTDCAAGIYLIRIVTDDGIWNHQIVRK